MATNVSRIGKQLLARETSVGIRIVKSFTDCTVVRKLTAKEEHTWEDWQPLEEDSTLRREKVRKVRA